MSTTDFFTFPTQKKHNFIFIFISIFSLLITVFSFSCCCCFLLIKFYANNFAFVFILFIFDFFPNNKAIAYINRLKIKYKLCVNMKFKKKKCFNFYDFVAFKICHFWSSSFANKIFPFYFSFRFQIKAKHIEFDMQTNQLNHFSRQCMFWEFYWACLWWNLVLKCEIQSK